MRFFRVKNEIFRVKNESFRVKNEIFRVKNEIFNFFRAKNEIFRVKMRFSIFRVKNEVSVAKIESIILSTFRVTTTISRFSCDLGTTGKPQVPQGSIEVQVYPTGTRFHIPDFSLISGSPGDKASTAPFRAFQLWRIHLL